MSSLKDVSLKDVGLKDVSLKDVGLKDVSLKVVVVPTRLGNLCTLANFSRPVVIIIFAKSPTFL